MSTQSLSKKSNQVSLISTRDQVTYAIDRDKFRSGLKNALKMGTYFFNLAKLADTPRWQIVTLEVEFDVSIGGDLKLATVNSTAQLLMDFNKEGT